MKLRLVVIDPPYTTLAIPEATDMFIKGLRVKLGSYQNVYASGVLPLDTYDFISTHHLICEESPEGELRPLCVYRTTEYPRCLEHRVAFTGMAVLNSSGATEHARILAGKLDEWHRQGLKISYGSGYAIEPSLRARPEVRELIREAFVACYARYEIETQADHILACGVIKVHTDRFFGMMGYERVAHEGEELPPFPQASLIGDDAVLVHCEKFSFWARTLMKKFDYLWQERIVLAAPGVAEKTRKAA